MALFVQNGELTPDGKAVLSWLEGQVAPFDVAGANVTQLSQMSGYLKEYYALTRSKARTPQAWLETFTSSAQNAYEAMKFLETKAAEEEAAKQKLSENSEATNKIAAELEAFKKTIRESVAEEVARLERQNAELRAELDKKANKGGRPAKVAAPEPEPEDTEDEAPIEGETAGA